MIVDRVAPGSYINVVDNQILVATGSRVSKFGVLGIT